MRLIPNRLPEIPLLSIEAFDQLRESIRAHGVLVPILVDAEGHILDGHERFEIIQELGLKTYPLRVFGTLTEQERQEIAIRVNCERRHLTRDERHTLLRKYLACQPGASSRQAAAACGVSQSTAARFARESPTQLPITGRDGKTYPRRPAATSVENLPNARRAAVLLAEAPHTIEGGITPASLRRSVFNAKISKFKDSISILSHQDYQLHIGDFRDTAKLIPNASIDAGLTDPPWGMDWTLLPELFQEYCRILKPGSLIAAYLGVHQIPSAIQAAQQAGLEFYWQVICRNDNKAGRALHGQINCAHRPVLVFRKPGKDRGRQELLLDVLDLDSQDKEYFRWQQPVAEAEKILRGITQPGWTVADLCTGSATTAIAAIEIGCRWVGCEIDPDTAKIANRRIAARLTSEK